MLHKINFLGLVLAMLGLCAATPGFTQDKVYLTSGEVQQGKVTEVGPGQVRMLMNVRPDGPVYVINVGEIDSIVYSNGMKEEMKGLKRKRALTDNIPELNTWTYDLLGFAFLTVSQSYERRLKNGIVGFRVPLYVGFVGGGIAGVGMFIPQQGVISAGNSGGGGFSIATGLNPKFYLFKRRIVRAFVGPEATIGYSKSDYYNSSYITYGSYYGNNGINRNGTVALLAKVGLSLNPLDKFNITIDGGAGVGDLFGGIAPLGAVGLWHIGLALGTNF